LIGFLINEAVKRRAIRYSPVGGCWNGAFSFQKLHAEGRGEEQKLVKKDKVTHILCRLSKTRLTFFPGITGQAKMHEDPSST